MSSKPSKMDDRLMLSVIVVIAACSSSPEPAAEAPAEAPMSTGAEEIAAPEPAPEPAAAPETPAAKPTEPQAPDAPPFGAIAVFKVKDYDAWRTAFDAHEQMRRDAGLVGQGVARSVDDPSTVMVWLAATSLDDVKGFTTSKELKAVMKEAGVVGKPAISLLENADNEPGSPDSKYGMFVTHTVKDYDDFKAVFDGHAAARTEAGLTGYDVSTDPADPNKVYVWTTAADVESLKAFTSSETLKTAMQEAGVKGKPKITIVELVDMKFYDQ